MARLARALPTAALVVALGAAAGCGSGVDGTFAPASATSTAPGASAPSTGPGAGTQAGPLPDPCGIVEDATLARLLGGAPIEQPYTGSRATFKACSWRADRTSGTTAYGSLGVQLILVESIGSTSGEQYAKERFEADKGRTSSLGQAEATGGLGDDAFFRYQLIGSRVHNVRLVVLVKATTLTVDYNFIASTDKQATVEGARSAATEALRKL